MKLNPPRKITWWAGLILMLFALIARLMPTAGFADYAFLLAMVAAVLMLAATRLGGL